MHTLYNQHCESYQSMGNKTCSPGIYGLDWEEKLDAHKNNDQGYISLKWGLQTSVQKLTLVLGDQGSFTVHTGLEWGTEAQSKLNDRIDSWLE